jgi:hypothetical protein
MPEVTQDDIDRVLKNGNWMIRADNNGASPSPEANGFRWNDIGEWTTAPDWDEYPVCGKGLHGQDMDYGGYISGTRVVFCETMGRKIPLGNKVKVSAARILMIGIPTNILFKRNLSLQGTHIASLPKGLSVGGSLYLQGTQIAKKLIPRPLLKKCIL